MRASARLDHGHNSRFLFRPVHSGGVATRGIQKEALSEFMINHSRTGEWWPELPEPTIVNGSPPPRRSRGRAPRSPLARTNLAHEDTIMSPMAAEVLPPDNPVITLTDHQLRQAFGPSPIFGATPPSPKRSNSEDADAELEAMKQLSIEELLTVFKGSPVPTSTALPEGPRAPPASPMHSFDNSPWTLPASAPAAKSASEHALAWPPLSLG